MNSLLASHHMLLCSISAVTAEAFQRIQGHNASQRRKEFIREILHKAFTLFLCCLLGIRLVFTVSTQGQNSDPGCHASLALLRKDRSLLVCTSRPLRASGLGDRSKILHDGNLPPLQQVVFVQLQLDGEPLKKYSSVSIVFFVSVDRKSE